MINLLDNTPNNSSKFRTKDWTEKKEDACGTCNKDSQIKFKTSILKSSLCDYSHAYILVSETETVVEQEQTRLQKLQIDIRNNLYLKSAHGLATA